MRRILVAFAVLALAAPVAAQEAPAQPRGRSPAARETLVDLAYVLGQAHALRTLCEGEGEQYWRARMARLSELERPDEAFREQLFESFNTGFVTAQAAHPRCDRTARAEAVNVAARGRDLARVLASAR
jgi:uncharacterized protein (TIGR02301 family)